MAWNRGNGTGGVEGGIVFTQIQKFAMKSPLQTSFHREFQYPVPLILLYEKILFSSTLKGATGNV